MPDEIKALSDLIPDANNANRGTERGRTMLSASLKQHGAGRSILLDRKGRIIAGNKTAMAAAGAGLEDVQVIQTDGRRLIAVQRMDLDLEDGTAARELAYADNRVGQVDLEWDADQLLKDVGAGLDLSALFFDWELEKMGGTKDGGEWEGMPEFENENQLDKIPSIIVHFLSQKDREEFGKKLGQKITEKTKYIYFPAIEDVNGKAYIAQDES